jgi:hypothetical protein
MDRGLGLVALIALVLAVLGIVALIRHMSTPDRPARSDPAAAQRDIHQDLHVLAHVADSWRSTTPVASG